MDRKVYVLFNDAINTFYLRLYGVGHMIKIYREELGNGQERKCFI